MIFDKLANCERYRGLSGGFARAFDYLQRVNLLEMPIGRYEIDGDRVYALNQCQPLKEWSEGIWEAHRNYADIQAVLKGEEILGFRSIDGLAVKKEYDPAGDVMFFEDEEGFFLPVRDGDFMVFFPNDAHRPCIRRADAPASAASRRVVVKVLL